MAIRRYATKSGQRRYQVEWRLPGRVKRRRSFKTLREAQVFEAEVVAARAQGSVIDPGRGDKITLEFAYKSWLATRRPEFTAKVLRGVEDNWRLHVGKRWAAYPLTKIHRSDVQDWANEMTCSPRTVRWRHTLLRQILEHAVAEQWLGRNAAAGTKFPPLKHFEHTYLTPEQVDRLAELTGSDVVLFLAYTGLRWGELAGLRVQDIRLADRRIAVRRSLTDVAGTLVEGATKSRAGTRLVPVVDRLVPLLRARIEGRGPDELAITTTAHTYADVYADELDGLADALNGLSVPLKDPAGRYDGPTEAHCEGQLTIEDELGRDGN